MKNLFIYILCLFPVIIPMGYFGCAVCCLEEKFEWSPVFDWVIVDKKDYRTGPVKITRDTITLSTYQSYDNDLLKGFLKWEYVIVDTLKRHEK